MSLWVFALLLFLDFFFGRILFHLLLNEECVMYPLFLRLENMVSVYRLEEIQLENKISTLIYPLSLRLENTAFTLRNGCNLIIS